MGWSRDHSRRWSMKSSVPESAQWRSWKTRTTVPVDGEPLEERSPRAEQLVGDEIAAAIPRSSSIAGSIQRRSGSSGTTLVQHRGDLGPGRRLVVRLGQPGPPADHLAERPERDPLAVGGRATVVPPRPRHDPVEVLLELPGEPALADAARPDDRDVADPPLPGRSRGRGPSGGGARRRGRRTAPRGRPTGRGRRARRRRGAPARRGPARPCP